MRYTSQSDQIFPSNCDAHLFWRPNNNSFIFFEFLNSRNTRKRFWIDYSLNWAMRKTWKHSFIMYSFFHHPIRKLQTKKHFVHDFDQFNFHSIASFLRRIRTKFKINKQAESRARMRMKYHWKIIWYFKFRIVFSVESFFFIWFLF